MQQYRVLNWITYAFIRTWQNYDQPQCDIYQSAAELINPKNKYTGTHK